MFVFFQKDFIFFKKRKITSKLQFSHLRPVLNLAKQVGEEQNGKVERDIGDLI